MTEHFRKLERMYAAAPINDYFQPALEIRQGEAEVRIQVREDFHHAAGAMHGVIYFKALDDSTFFAANSIVRDVFVLTAHFEIDFLRPVSSGEVRAIARVSQETDRRIEAIGELFDEAGNLVGRGTGSFARSNVPLTPDVHYV
jgi:uncharacterized protein (TIGR00369 family)